MLYKEVLIFFKSAVEVNEVFMYLIIIFVLIAFGYVNQILTQCLDYFIRNNYNLFDRSFEELRDKVKSELSKLEIEIEILDILGFNDYNLYQILGDSITVSNNYVDEVKSIHSFAVALE